MAASVAALACAEASLASPIIASPNRNGATIASKGIFTTQGELLLAKLGIIQLPSANTVALHGTPSIVITFRPHDRRFIDRLEPSPGAPAAGIDVYPVECAA